MRVRRFKKDLGHVLPCVSLCMGGSAMQPVHRLCTGHPGSTAWMLAVFGSEGVCAAITDPHLHTVRVGFLLTQNPKCMALVRRCFPHDHSGIQFPPSLCSTITQGLRVLCWVPSSFSHSMLVLEELSERVPSSPPVQMRTKRRGK